MILRNYFKLELHCISIKHTRAIVHCADEFCIIGVLSKCIAAFPVSLHHVFFLLPHYHCYKVKHGEV